MTPPRVTLFNLDPPRAVTVGKADDRLSQVVNQITDICFLRLSSSVALINACTAELDEGIVSLASLIGREVKAEGSIVNGTLIAREIEVDNDPQCGGDD